MKYSVRSGSRRHKLEVDREADFAGEVSVEVGKEHYAVRIHEKGPAGELRAVAVNNRVYSVQVRRRPDGFPYKILLNGAAYPVEIERVESTRYKPPVPERKIDGTIRASLPGQITRILVNEGENVKKDQVLMVLEAMKMENDVVSPLEGVVRHVSVRPKQLVMKNDLLLSVE